MFALESDTFEVIAKQLREQLNLTGEWVEVIPPDRYVTESAVCLATTLRVMEDGDPENGPHVSVWAEKWLHVTEHDLEWTVEVYDESRDPDLDDQGEPKPVIAFSLGRMAPSLVAARIVAVCRALNVTFECRGM